MNPLLFSEIDFSYFSSFFSFFSFENDEQKKKNGDKYKYKDKLIHKKFKKLKTLKKQNISKTNLDASLESTFSEEENGLTNKKEIQYKKKYNDYNISIKEDLDEENILNMDKKEKEIKRVKKQIIKEEKKVMNINNKLINKNLKKTEDELRIFLVNYIKNVYIFRKRVKLLVKKHKKYYAILNQINKDYYTSMNIQIDNKEKTKLKYIYEPILNEYILYISRKLYINKKLIKFNFINKNNERIVNPNLTIEFHKGEFVNIINLKEIRKKEKNNTKEFMSFIEKNYRNRHISSEETEDCEEKNKNSFGKAIHEKNAYYSILKKRPKKRIISNKKISFSEKCELRPYKKY